MISQQSTSLLGAYRFLNIASIVPSGKAANFAAKNKGWDTQFYL